MKQFGQELHSAEIPLDFYIFYAWNWILWRLTNARLSYITRGHTLLENDVNCHGAEIGGKRLCFCIRSNVKRHIKLAEESLLQAT